jgi:hypothetical protein
MPIQMCVFCSRKSWRCGKTGTLAKAGYLNHEDHQEHKDFSFLRDLGGLRGWSFYGVANPGLAIGEYLAVRTIHLKWVSVFLCKRED